jgi:hypothetical protein
MISGKKTLVCMLIKVNENSTVWEAALLVLLMGVMHEVYR